MQDKLDPFKFFQLEYKYEIVNLDTLYYNLFKKNENIHELHLAYNILKNPIKKILFLCEYYKISGKIDLKEVMRIKSGLIEYQKTMKDLYLNKAIQEAKLNNWQMAYININYVIYL